MSAGPDIEWQSVETRLGDRRYVQLPDSPTVEADLVMSPTRHLLRWRPVGSSGPWIPLPDGTTVTTVTGRRIHEETP